MSVRHSYAVLAACLILCLGGGMLIGLSNPPGAWYQTLAKPGFTPPDWLFPVAWTVLYALMTLAGWRVFLSGPRVAQALWVLQLVLNFAWSPTFFGAHRIGLGLGLLAALLVTIILFIAATARTNRTAFLCFLPYAAWVALATALNLAIWRLN